MFEKIGTYNTNNNNVFHIWRIQSVHSNCQESPLRPPVELFIPDNRGVRVQFAGDHVQWTEQQRMEVIWIKESKHNMLGSDGIVYVLHLYRQGFNKNYIHPLV